MLRIFLILFLSIVIAGCSAANFVVKPYSNLEVKSAHNINPDSNGRP
ncbi:type VI secretion system lipoprotein TssJ, partial [Vibrio rotiferianus]